jgi:hypothetical protein
MPPVGFERTISAGERPQAYVLDRAATEMHRIYQYDIKLAFNKTVQQISKKILNL